jgi:hypothetical protein
MDIYSDPTSIQTLANEDTTVDQLVDMFKSADQFGNRAKVHQAVICARIQKKVLDENGGKMLKAYREKLVQICLGFGIKRHEFNRNVAIGEYVITRNDPDVYTMPKSKIQELITPPKQKAEKKAAAPKPNPELTAALKRVEDLQQRVSDYAQILTYFQTGIEKSGMDWLEYLEKRKLPTYSFA